MVHNSFKMYFYGHFVHISHNSRSLVKHLTGDRFTVEGSPQVHESELEPQSNMLSFRTRGHDTKLEATYSYAPH